MEIKWIQVFKEKNYQKSLILLYSVITVNKKYYSQILLEEHKYEIKKTKIEPY